MIMFHIAIKPTLKSNYTQLYHVLIFMFCNSHRNVAQGNVALEPETIVEQCRKGIAVRGGLCFVVAALIAL